MLTQMLVKRLEQHSFSNFITSYETVYYWCSDGWCYDGAAKIRRKYMTDDSIFKVIEEPYKGPYSDVQMVENVLYILVSEKPKIWIEKGDLFEECFEEIACSPDN